MGRCRVGSAPPGKAPAHRAVGAPQTGSQDSQFSRLNRYCGSLAIRGGIASGSFRRRSAISTKQNKPGQRRTAPEGAD
eukprot:9602651-Alexandrium_andersonii.AAC.1